MKKITLLMVALLLSVVGANAKTVTTTTELTIDKDGIISSAQFTSASEGDVITFSHEESGGTHFKLFYKIGDEDSWAYHKFTGVTYNSAGANDYYTPWINYGDTYTITITSDNLKEMKDYGIWLEDYADITNVTLTHSGIETETSKTTLWSGSTEFESNWSVGQSVSGQSTAKIGDVIRGTITATSGATVQICNSSWTVFADGEFTLNSSESAQTFEFEIQTADVLESIQQNGLVIKGSAGTLSEIELLTYSSSYDVVSVTIGSDEVATFSSSKKLDFTASGISVYYASVVTTGSVTLTKVTDNTTWDHQGYILKGVEGTYTIPVTNSATYQNTDYLMAQVSEGTVVASTSGKYHYIFAKDSEGKIGFFNLAAPYTLGAHKAYLETSTNIKPDLSRIALVFDDGETTGIQELENSSIEELKNSGNEALKAYYNLNGQRVANPRKGLYVVNGKKVIIK